MDAATVLRLLERVEPLGDGPVGGGPVGALGDEALAWLRVAERATALALRSLGPFDATGTATATGATSTASWLAAHGPVTKAAASRLVGAARLAHHHPDTAKALATGDISVTQAETAGAAVRPPGFDDLYTRDETVLLDAARTLTPDRFTRALRHRTNLADDALGHRDAARSHDRRGFTLSPLPDGSSMPGGRRDPTTTALLTAALDPTMGPPDAVTDHAPRPRTVPQRRHDALRELAREHLSGANQRAGAPVATVDVIVDLDTLTGQPPTDLTHRRGDAIGTGPVPLATIEQLLCDSSLGRVLMRGPTEIVDVGRRSRTFTPTQRRAMIARDGPTCTHPGCDRPAHRCDAHHDHPWHHHGPTDLDHGRMLCRWHHTWHHHHRPPPRTGPAPGTTGRRATSTHPARLLRSPSCLGPSSSRCSRSRSWRPRAARTVTVRPLR